MSTLENENNTGAEKNKIYHLEASLANALSNPFLINKIIIIKYLRFQIKIQKLFVNQA